MNSFLKRPLFRIPIFLPKNQLIFFISFSKFLFLKDFVPLLLQASGKSEVFNALKTYVIVLLAYLLRRLAKEIKFLMFLQLEVVKT